MSASDPQGLATLFAERASAGDLDGLLELYEEDAAFVAPDGELAAGAAAIRARLEDLLAASPVVTPLGDPEVVLAGDVALISGRWQLTLGGKQPSTVQGRSTEVARRQPAGGWRYLVDQPTLDGVPAAAAAPAAAESDGVEPEPSVCEQLRYAQDGPVARITLNRPQRHNALSIALSAELTTALEHVRRSRTVKVLVLAGAGTTFCAGDDITEMPAWGDADAVMRRVRSYQHMANVLEELDKPTIAAVDGYAVGGGLELTMACDFVIATERARWGMPEVDVGITPGWGGTTRMARLIGRRTTKEVNLLGALHPARRAVQLGLWNRVVADDRLEPEVDALVDVLLSKNQQALRQLKFIITRGVEADQYTAQGFEAISAALSGAVNGAWRIPDADPGRGVIGFAQKSEPWQTRRALAREFWADGPLGPATEQESA